MECGVSVVLQGPFCGCSGVCFRSPSAGCRLFGCPAVMLTVFLGLLRCFGFSVVPHVFCVPLRLCIVFMSLGPSFKSLCFRPPVSGIPSSWSLVPGTQGPVHVPVCSVPTFCPWFQGPVSGPCCQDQVCLSDKSAACQISQQPVRQVCLSDKSAACQTSLPMRQVCLSDKSACQTSLQPVRQVSSLSDKSAACQTVCLSDKSAACQTSLQPVR